MCDIGKIRPKFKLWLHGEESEGVFGDGKWRLLKEIERQGSLKAAAETLGISYRKAWGDLRKAEQRLGIKFIEKHRGGHDGGETCLTEVGKEWVKGYGRLRAKVEEAVDEGFNEHFGKHLKR